MNYDPLPDSVTFPAGADTATVTVVPVAGPFECGYGFTTDSWNTTQTVAVGVTLYALTLEEVTPPSPATGVFRLVSGARPSDVELRSDGSFGGSPTAPQRRPTGR